MPDDRAIFPSIPQPPMNHGHVGPGSQPTTAIIDNRTDLPDEMVMEAVRDQWVETAGLQFNQPNNFQLYSNFQSSMLARTPFKTPGNVIEEIKLARSIADTDDDVAATIGQCLALAYGEGLQNHHRDETTLEFFKQMTAPQGINLESLLEEMHREFLLAGQVTTLVLFTRQRMKYFPLKSDTAVEAQLQVPHVGILPSENLRVLTNDILNTGELGYWVEDLNLKRWLDEFFNSRTDPAKRAWMAMQEPVPAALFTGRIEVPFNDGDVNSRGKTIYTLNQKMIHRTTMPKGAMPYPRPLLTRNFGLLEAKRLLNIMDYALLQGGTNYIVVAKKGTDALPAQQPEIENLVNQVTHASRSGVMVGDHRLSLEIITPDLEELLNPSKRKLLGRKIAMGLMRQAEQVEGEGGTQGALNEVELTGRVVTADRAKMLRHAEAAFYQDTAERNRSVFKQGAPTIWGPKIILAGAKDFWSNVLNARDRGDIPRRWAVEALGFNYDAGLAEREREVARGDDDILLPAAVPFSNPGEPQDNNQGRPKGTSSNNGRGRDTPGQGKDKAAPNRVIKKTAGETVRAIVEGTEVNYYGETTLALLEDAEGGTIGYVTKTEMEAIENGEATRSGKSLIMPVNIGMVCTEFRTVKLDDGLRVVVGRRLGDEAMVAKALRFTEPTYDLKDANDLALRWGFTEDVLTEDATEIGPEGTTGETCPGCSAPLLQAPTILRPFCPSCGYDTSKPAGGSGAGSGDADVAAVCLQCRGTGKVEGGTMVGMMVCPRCKGTGQEPTAPPTP